MVNKLRGGKEERRAAILVCLVVLGIMAVAGLWPFHAPLNQVSWLRGGGLNFHRNATVWSAGTFPVPSPQQETPCSLEIWLQPESTTSARTFLAFHTPGTHFRFLLRQLNRDLILEAATGEQLSGSQGAVIGNAFEGGRPVFLTITAGTHLDAYWNGVRATPFQQFGVSTANLAGELILGTDPEDASNWSGQMKGLAFYRREFSPAEVAQHYERWMAGAPEVDRQTIALYRFREGAGDAVHNEVRGGIDLAIPVRFRIWDKLFLQRPWDEFRPGYIGYWRDVTINIVGFMPFGFAFYAWFGMAQMFRKRAGVTILCGTLVSLTIEVSQYFLPTRNSGMTDLVTNTLGTALGVLVYRIEPVRALYHWALGLMANGWRYAVGSGRASGY